MSKGESILSHYDPYQKALNRELKEVFSSREGFLYDLLRYHLGWVDQRGVPEENPIPFHFPSMLALISCEALSGDYRAALPAAAAIELVYNFVLVHGEVQSGGSDTGDRPSVWWVWGPAQAINAGDGLHAMARLTIMRMAAKGIPPEQVLRAVRALDRATLALCEGQFMDLTLQEQPLVSSSAYYDAISRKTGALTGCSAELGALSAGADEAVSSCFHEMGVKLGVAWQIMQDIGELWGPRGDGITFANVLNKKKGLPVVYALENASIATKRELASIYGKRVLEADDVTRILSALDRAGARAHAEDNAKALLNEAVALLAETGLSEKQMEPIHRLGRLALGTP